MITTKDMGLIITLNALGQRYVDYQVDNQGRIFFRYPDTPEVKEIEEGFFRNTIKLPVQDFISSQLRVKTLIFEIKRKVSYTNDNNYIGSSYATR